MSGGVRNLRAMFENKEESTMPPPDRGRSPAGSIGGGSNGTSPRPLSKVRTSFVAVERSGQLGPQWGLRKESSTDPTLATRRASSSIDEENDLRAIADRKQSINSEGSAKNNSTTISETIPEFAIETPPLEKRPGYVNGNGGRVKVISAESLLSTSQIQKSSPGEHHTKLIPGEIKSNTAVGGRAATTFSKSGGFDENLNANGTGKRKPSSPTKAGAGTALSSRTTRPGPISTAPSLVTAKASTKPTISPPHPKTPTTPAKPSKGTTPKPAASSIAKAQVNSADMKAARSTASSTSNLKMAARPTTSLVEVSTSENKAPQPSPPTGSHKPKPKSPTRPAKLPASMTAPTASSLSKVTSVAPTIRQSLAPVDKTVSRSRSHASLTQKQDLHHRPSRLDNDRPALGRPPTIALKKQQSRPSLPKQTLPVEESFLARMMRPTTSSASKTTEKVITPPRVKTHTRPTTREGLPSHKLHQGLKGSPSTKRLPAAVTETPTEDLCAIHLIEAEETLELAHGIGESEPALLEKEMVPAPIDLVNGAFLASSHKNNNIHEDLVLETTQSTLDLEQGADIGVNTTQQVGLLGDHDDLKIDDAVYHSTEEPKAGEATEHEEDHNHAAKTSEATASNEERLVSEKQGVPEPAHDVEKDYPSTGFSEPQKMELEVTDTVMID